MHGGQGDPGARRCLLSGLLGTVVVVARTMVTLAGAVLVVVLVAAVAPALAAHDLRRRRHGRGPRRLSDSELTAVWGQVRPSSRDAMAPARLAAVIETRQELLDELQHRDPAGFRRWVAGEEWPAAAGSAGLRRR